MQGPGMVSGDSGMLKQSDEQGITRLLPTAAHAAALTSALPRPTTVEMPASVGGGEVCAASPPAGEEPVTALSCRLRSYNLSSTSWNAHSLLAGSHLCSSAAPVTQPVLLPQGTRRSSC